MTRRYRDVVTGSLFLGFPRRPRQANVRAWVQCIQLTIWNRRPDERFSRRGATGAPSPLPLGANEGAVWDSTCRGDLRAPRVGHVSVCDPLGWRRRRSGRCPWSNGHEGSQGRKVLGCLVALVHGGTGGARPGRLHHRRNGVVLLGGCPTRFSGSGLEEQGKTMGLLSPLVHRGDTRTHSKDLRHSPSNI